VFAELKAPKIFWIKKLICQSTPELESLGLSKKNILGTNLIELKDVIVLRNIFTTECLKTVNHTSQPESQNCIYFSSVTKKESYKIIWTGPELTAQNSSITKCTIQKYKRELIAFRPNILKHTFEAVHNA